MSQFPSEVAFGALLQYAVRGQSPLSRRSRDVRTAIKTNGVLGSVAVIAHAAVRAKENLEADGCLSRLLGPDVTLVPMPRSSLIKEGSLWPARVICEALRACGIGDEILPCLSRAEAIGKAAFAASDRRPDPPDHYRTIRVESVRPLDSPTALVLVDDIVTRGSSFVGVLPHLTATFPGTPIHCFALLRTISQGDIESILDPVAGRITYRAGHLHRDP
ncbi:hypothetical protein [Thiocapsa rosea]|uniref:Phosphoribosyl transferase-like protein n=1 Tax=Thiocapsa rosea TaxID=69360 RepID=A0A495UNS9_9GAMM|nr:hypothetical protein [Thiocapsa rosea]RKT37963.1 hypothetical protein BDD21_5475 [Thiocapsa rosea]